MYTKVQFGKDLKQRVSERESVKFIGRWAFSAYWEHILDIEHDVRRIALDLGTIGAWT